ncbi:MAG: phage regulatory CII family protein [Pseudomonadota bacterium]
MLFQPATLFKLIHEMPFRSGVSLEDLAEAAGKGYKTLSREMYPDDHGAKIGLDTLVYITARCQDFAALDYMETALGRVAFELPRAAGLSGLHQSMATAAKECGDVLQQLCGDLADGKLDEPELALKEISEAAQALACLRAAVLAEAKTKQAGAKKPCG